MRDPTVWTKTSYDLSTCPGIRVLCSLQHSARGVVRLESRPPKAMQSTILRVACPFWRMFRTRYSNRSRQSVAAVLLHFCLEGCWGPKTCLSCAMLRLPLVVPDPPLSFEESKAFLIGEFPCLATWDGFLSD